MGTDADLSSVLETGYDLDPTAYDRFQRNGFAIVRGLCPSEAVAGFRALIVDAVRRLNTETRPLEQRDTYGKAFLQTTNLWEADESVARFSCARRFAQVAADLMGVDAVRIYHDQALFKEGGGGPTPWHQDQYYWPLECKTITMWMPLVDASDEMGTMHFAAGSQREGYLRAVEISDESEAFYSEFVRSREYEETAVGALRAGDATFHSGWTLHCAGPNKTHRTREAMTVIYYEDGASIVEPDHQNRQKDLERWFPGCAPGDLAASPINPVVFSR